ncbi:MAG: penicillin acylase family protein, partial [Kofleriaceae bacterium]
DVLGITFPGIPGVILGSNGKLAWAATVSEHDVNDVYLESIAPCGGGDCVAFGGQQVPIQTVTEEIRIGVFGDVIDRFTATYEIVPHHGPIIPAVGPDHRLVPRPPGSDALSVRYTGHQPTLEIRALWKLVHATSVQQGFEALGDFRFGSQNWTMIDQAQDLGWTTHAVVPVRSPASYRWHAVDRPDAAAPFFVLDGTGAFEWEGELSNQYIPHARMPLGNGQAYLATANADPVGATFDNDPLNQPMIDGRPLYVGVSYAAGVREERITELLTRGGALTLDDMAAIQHDTFSNVGAKLVPHVLAALDAVAGAPPAMPADVAPYLAGLPLADRQRLAAARDLLAGWTFATPVALDAPDRDSAATALFNTWMHFFLRDTLSDELATIDRSPWDLGSNQLLRIAYEMVKPDGVVSRSATTGQAMLCDRAAVTGPDDSCTKAVLEAMLAAMQHLGGPDGFATSDTAQWRWGTKHRLTLQPLFPNPSLDLPRPGELALPGFPKPGDNFNVNRSDHGWADLDFSQFADGPAQRFLAESRPGEPIKVRWQIPGGVIYDSRSPHYRDLLDKYYLPQQHFDAPFAVSEIVAHGEHRWEFR